MKINLLALLVATVLSVATPLACAQLTDDQAKTLMLMAAAGDAEALSILRQTAAMGDARAQVNLAAMYAAGKGMSLNYVEAAKWFRKAADQGESEAQILLGIMYYKGRGVPQNYSEAVKLYRKPAEQGNAGAQVLLAGMLVTGRGVPQNYVQAYKWLTLSKATSNPGNEIYINASKGIELLAKKMTQAQIARAQAEASVWVPKHSDGQ